MRLRIALAVVAVCALALGGLFACNLLNDTTAAVDKQRTAATARVRTQAQQYADALAAEASSPSDTRLAELGEPFDVRVLAVQRAASLTVQISSRAQYSPGGAGTAQVEGCYTVVALDRTATLIELPCPSTR